MNRSTLLAAGAGFLMGVLTLSINVGREVHIPIGGGRGPLMMSGLGESEAATALPKVEVGDARRDFYFRQIEGNSATLEIPLRSAGPFSLGLRMDSTVRTRIFASSNGAVVGEAFVPTGPWAEWRIASNVQPSSEYQLIFEDAPLVRRSEGEIFRRYADEIVLRSEAGFTLPWASRIVGGLLVALVVLLGAGAAAHRLGLGLILAIVATALLAFVGSVEPAGLALALPRLAGFVVIGLLGIALAGRILSIDRIHLARLGLLATMMILVCGFLSFLPNHSPADLDIHIWRTVDFVNVPMTYDAWLRYGSHYPTPSQIRGAATEALGEGPLIPYSPLPYVFFYAAHSVGLDLHWSINALEATALASLLPLIFAFARMASSDQGGMLAVVLMSLDLATIHHLGRAHAPAVFGGALGIAGLFAFGLALPHLRKRGHVIRPALCLGVAALGYSSTPLFYALVGIMALGLLAWQADGRSLVWPVAVTLAVGAAIALLLFYGHYIPGLMGGRGAAMASDPFPGRTFFIFHNESRQSLRLWRMGFYFPLLAVLPAMLLVWRRSSVPVRTFLLAWISAWAGVMLLKEPWGFPLLLRWAKEDFYVAPGLALVIAIAIARIESRNLRLTLATTCVIVALCLRVNDYGFHADTLRFVR